MEIFSCIASCIDSIFQRPFRENKKRELNIAEENEKAYKNAKNAFDHFFDDEKSIEVHVGSNEDDG